MDHDRDGVTILTPDQDDMGRTTHYTEDAAIAICERHAAGQSLVEICQVEGMPARATLYRWLKERPDFSMLLELARDEFADKITREIVDIADKTAKVEDVPLSRLRMDARKTRMQWLLAKFFARRADAEVPPPPMTVTIHLDPEE